MSASISHEIRYDANLPAGTVRHIRTERRTSGAAAEAIRSDEFSKTKPGDAAHKPDASEPDETDLEIRSSLPDDADDKADNADDAKKSDRPVHRTQNKNDKKSDAMVQLFEEIHSIVEDLDAHGQATGTRHESMKFKQLGSPVSKDDARVKSATEQHVRPDGSGFAIVDYRDELQFADAKSHGGNPAAGQTTH